MDPLHTPPLTLHKPRTVRLTLTLPETTLLALYHYCLANDADAATLPRAAAVIVTDFLTRDATLRRFRAAHGATLPSTVPRSPRRGARHA